LLLILGQRLEQKSEATMYVSVLVRKLKPGKTVDDFVRAWYTGETLEQVMTRIAGQESR
jgi:hypothetical protein